VLKAKEGEKTALEMLDTVTVAEIWPLFEIVKMKEDQPDLGHHLRKAFQGLRRATRRSPVYLLDTHEIAPAGREGARAAFQAAITLGVPFIPVTGLSRKADVEEAITAATGRGLAIRLIRSEFERGIVPARLLSFLEHNRIAPADVHLIVDVGAVDEVLPEGVETMIGQFLPLVPLVSEWRTLTVVASAFPKSMGVAEPKSETFVERADWKGWLRACFERRDSLPRLPTYGDGGVQHPSGVEGFDPKVMPVSATIRYTLEDGCGLDPVPRTV
jgi:hypothetical protein